MITQVNKLILATTLVAMGLGSPARSASISSPALMESRGSNEVVASTSEGNAELFFLVEQLQREVVTLRGMVEELQYSVSVLKRQSRERYVDIDRRLQDVSRLETVLPAPVVGTDPVEAPAERAVPAGLPSDPRVSRSQAATPVISDQEKKAYQMAYNLIKKKSFEDAIDALHDFIERYPDSGLTANAYYWLGEVYLVAQKLEQAKAAFTVVINKFPDHRKTADAYYKLGVVYLKLGDKKKALSNLDTVISRFSDTSAARLAMELRKESF